MKLYYIVSTRHFYNSRSIARIELSYGDMHPLRLPYAEAKQYKEWLDQSTYVTSHNESGAPDYKLVGTDSDRGMSLWNLHF